ncbi:uncharacterized protein LOC134231221 [Saccostrea cucullata]|uniref:uncharacterized protein LOC134231221 n=1 Tax=Saccostrea cuccullata TaxID=36930 RepID=UPI002ED35B98
MNREEERYLPVNGLQCVQCKENLEFYLGDLCNENIFQFKIPKCSLCRRSLEFYCKTCRRDLCVICKEKHIIDLDTKHHDVVIDRLKYGDFKVPEFCERHQEKYLESWCFTCTCPTCAECEHVNHKILDIISAYDIFRNENNERIVEIRSEIIPNNQAIIASIKSDIETCVESKLSNLQQSIKNRIQRLKNLTDIVMNDISGLNVLMKSKLQKQHTNVTNTEKYIFNLEQLLEKPVRFLSHLKKTPIPRIKDIPGVSIISRNSEMSMEGVIKLLDEVDITETKKRRVRNMHLLELMYTPIAKKFLKMKGVLEVCHISCLTNKLIWVSNPNGNIILTTGYYKYFVIDTVSCSGGHSVTPEGNLIYIDRYHNINKSSTDNKIQYTLVKKPESLEAECVHCSHSNSDLLVGMMRYDRNKNIYTEAKVMRYNSTGQPIQTIEHDSSGQKLYKLPKYITENHNGDVIVSDLNNGVVVTDLAGRHRFSYTGPPSGLGLSPLGVCVDALSNILVCDAKSKKIQMIDQDGHFLSLFTKINRINISGGLAYDNRNHLLLVGTTYFSSRVSVYRHIQRKENLTDGLHD